MILRRAGEIDECECDASCPLLDPLLRQEPEQDLTGLPRLFHRRVEPGYLLCQDSSQLPFVCLGRSLSRVSRARRLSSAVGSSCNTPRASSLPTRPSSSRSRSCRRASPAWPFSPGVAEPRPPHMPARRSSYQAAGLGEWAKARDIEVKIADECPLNLWSSSKRQPEGDAWETFPGMSRLRCALTPM